MLFKLLLLALVAASVCSADRTVLGAKKSIVSSPVKKELKKGSMASLPSTFDRSERRLQAVTPDLGGQHELTVEITQVQSK
jgi:hypothetical protein